MIRTRALPLLAVLLSALTFAAPCAEPVPVPDGTLIIPWTRFSIQYTVRSIGDNGPQTVEFYYTTDGGRSWQLYGKDPDNKSPMTVQVPGEGVYGFATVGTDAFGNREREPLPGTSPETLIVVDRTPPTVAWISPKENQMLKGDGIEMAWESSDNYPADNPITIQYSTDGGTNWTTLKAGLPARGKVLWRPQVKLTGQFQLRLLVRDKAGNKRIANCTASVQSDHETPVVSLLGPTVSGKQEMELRYRADDNEGGSGIGKVGLYYTFDNGMNWHYYGEDNDVESPFPFTSPQAGRVGLFLAARDRAGNGTVIPSAGTEPPFTLLIDTQPPAVHLSQSFAGASNIVRVGVPATVRWTATDENVKENSATLTYSVDAGKTWMPIGSNLPVNTPYEWDVPDLPGMVTGTECYLRVAVLDQMGQAGVATSQPFQIETAGRRASFRPMDSSSIPTDETRPASVGSEDKLRTTRYANRDTEAAPSGTGSGPEPMTSPRPRTGTEPQPSADAPVVAATPQNTAAKEASAAEPRTSGTGKPRGGAPAGFSDFVSDGMRASAPPPATASAAAPVTEPARETPAPAPETTLGKTPDATLPSTADAPLPNKPEEQLPTDLNKVVAEAEITGDLLAAAPKPQPEAVLPSSAHKAASNTPPVSAPAETPIRSTAPAPVPTPMTPTSTPDAIARTLPGSDTPAPIPSNDAPTPATTPVPGAGTPAATPESMPVIPNSTVGQYITKAQEAIQNSQFDLAEQYCQQALQVDAKSAMAHAYMASVLGQKGAFKQAIEHARTAVAYDAQEPTYLRVLGESHLQFARSIREAESKLPAAATSQKLELQSELNLALNEAESTFSRIRIMSPQSKTGYEKMGDVAYFRARTTNSTEQSDAAYAQAIEMYEKSYSLGKGTYKEAFQIGVCHFNRKDYEKAQHWLELAVENAGTETPKEAFFYLGKLHDEMERPAEALPYWIRASKSYPDGNKYRDYAAQRAEAIKRELEQP